MRSSALVALLTTLSAPAFAAPSLTVTLPEDLVIGQPVVVTLSGTVGEGEPVYLAVSSLAPGSGPCPDALGGRCLGIRAPMLLGSIDYTGAPTTFTITLPPTAVAGTSLSFQAAVVRGLKGRRSVLSAVVAGVAQLPDSGCIDPLAINHDPEAEIDDGSCVYDTINPTGTVLVPSSTYIDPSPPAGWTQCSGYTNTEADDVTGEVLDNCLNTTRLRLRWWNSEGVLVVDVYAEDLSLGAAWPDFNYLGGAALTQVVATEWTGITPFFTDLEGDACNFDGQTTGVSLGAGNLSVPLVSPADNDPTKELRINCGGDARLGYSVALYR